MATHLHAAREAHCAATDHYSRKLRPKAQQPAPPDMQGAEFLYTKLYSTLKLVKLRNGDPGAIVPFLVDPIGEDVDRWDMRLVMEGLTRFAA